jgi:RNA polymerase sigma-70 factor (ECF subfamily)
MISLVPVSVQQFHPSDRTADVEHFSSTHWSLVVAAGQLGSPAAKEALSELCRQYWVPVYGYIRRRIGDLHEAQDLTQEFFQQVLERKFFAQADPSRGRLRAFLLTALRNFLANQRQKARAQKRGGGQTVLDADLWRPDFADGESRLALDRADENTPEKLFDRQWAIALLDQVVAKLQAESVAADRQLQFDVLKPLLAGARDADTDYRQAATQLGISVDAAKMAATRLRRRYREVLRDEIAQTVLQPEDVDQELRYLFEALG